MRYSPELHDNKNLVAVFKCLDRLDNMRMINAGSQLGLAIESRDGFFITMMLWIEHLQRDNFTRGNVH